MSYDDDNGSWDSDVRFERDLDREVHDAHRDMTPRMRAALARTMGAVQAHCAPVEIQPFQSVDDFDFSDEDPTARREHVGTDEALNVLRNSGLL